MFSCLKVALSYDASEIGCCVGTDAIPKVVMEDFVVNDERFVKSDASILSLSLRSRLARFIKLLSMSIPKILSMRNFELMAIDT